jgi:hypothetical protein
MAVLSAGVALVVPLMYSLLRIFASLKADDLLNFLPLPPALHFQLS